MGNPLEDPSDLGVDSAGNVYVCGIFSDNAFRITPGGVITEIVDDSGDGAGQFLSQAIGLAATPGGVVIVSGQNSDNALSVVHFFRDGFETGDTRAWSEVELGPP
jgi:hypothetical protein